MPGHGTFGDYAQLHTLGFIDKNGYLSKKGGQLLGH